MTLENTQQFQLDFYPLFFLELSSPNIFGRGEKLSINYSYSYVKATELNLKLFKPFYHTAFGDFKPEWVFDNISPTTSSNKSKKIIFRTSLSLYKHSNIAPFPKGFKSDHAGVLFDFSFLFPLSVSHSVQYDCGYKELSVANKSTPFFIREQCGPRLVPTLRHIMAYDSREDSVFPRQGVYLRTTTEIFGDALTKYGAIKSDTHIELNVPLFAGASLSLCGRIGRIFEDRKIVKSTPIDSLFFLGGPQSLRGFEVAGATPVKDGVPRGSQVRKIFASFQFFSKSLRNFSFIGQPVFICGLHSHSVDTLAALAIYSGLISSTM